MNKSICRAGVTIFLLFAFPLNTTAATDFNTYPGVSAPAASATDTANPDIIESAAQYADPNDYGLSEVESALEQSPEGLSAAQILNDNTNGGQDPSALLSLNPLRLIDGLCRMFISRAVSPFKMFIALASAAALCGLFNSLPKSGSIASARLAATLFAAAAIFAHSGAWLTECRASLSAGGAFMLTFVPVYSGIMAVTGQVAGASVWNAAMLIEAQVFTAVLTAVIMPLCEGILALSLISAAFDGSAGVTGTSGIAAFIKKAVIWVLGFMMALFVGLLSVQGIIAAAADNGASKALKFAVSGAVPIVGGAIGDGLATFRSSMSVMRAGMGGFGTTAFILVMLPGILTAAAYKLAFAAARGVSGVFGIKSMTGMFASAEKASDIALACLLGFGMITVVSVAVVMSFGGNT